MFIDGGCTFWILGHNTHCKQMCGLTASVLSQGLTAAQTDKVRKLIFSDLQLYDALNKTFHEKLAKKGPQFHKDLALFRQRKAEIFDRCNEFEQWEEDKHRKILLEGPKLTPEIRECHAMMLDSKGFVKLMKRNLGIQTRECTTVSVFPMRHLALFIARGVDASVFSSFAYRGAVAHKLAALVPKLLADDDTVSDVDWDHPDTLTNAVESTNRRKDPQVMAETFTRFNRVVLNKVPILWLGWLGTKPVMD